MANGIDASSGVTEGSQILSDPNLTGSSFSRQGVVDESSRFMGDAISDLVGTVGQAGLDIDEGFAKAQLDKNINSFIDQADPKKLLEKKDSIFDESEQSLARLQQSQLDSADRGEDLSQVLSKSAPEFQSIMSKLGEAKRQGLITRDEVEIRAREATRKAIARRPGLAQELTRHAEQVLNLSGIRDIDQFEQDLAKAEAKRAADAEKRILDRATKFGIPFDRLNPDIPYLNEKIQRMDRENEALRVAEQLQNLEEADVAKNKEVILQNAPLVRQGLLNEFGGKVAELFTPGMSQSEMSAAFVNLRVLGDEFINKGDTLLSAARLNTSEAAPHREATRRQIDGLINEIKKHEGAENIADISANVSRWLKSLEESAVRGEMNVTKINLIGQLSNTIMGATIFKSDEVQERIGGALSQLISSELTKNNYEYLIGNKDEVVKGVPNLVTGVKAIMQAGVVSDSDTTEQAKSKPEGNDFETALTHAADLLIENPHGVSSEQRYNTLKHIVLQFGKSDVIPYLNNASSGAKKQLGNLYDQQRQVLTTQRDKEIAKAEDRGAKVRTSVTPTGQIVFDVEHPTPQVQRELSNRLNNGIGNRTNELVQASSILFGLNTKETLRLMEENNNGFVERKSVVGGQVEVSVGSKDFMDKLVQVESAGDPNAEASTSNAVGLTQFIPSTWNSMIDKHAPELREGKSPEEVLELRKDPELSRQMAARLAEDNARILRASGVEESDSNLYLAHFLGAGQATNVLTERDDTPLEEIIGARAIAANKSIMKGKTVGDLKDWAKSKMGG